MWADHGTHLGQERELDENDVSTAARPVSDETEFVALLKRLIETWPFMIAFCQPLVQDFAETLPVVLAQPFATLLVRLRAARGDQG